MFTFDPLKASENVRFSFQGVSKGNNGKKRVKEMTAKSLELVTMALVKFKICTPLF